MNSRWFIKRTNPEFIQYLSKTAGITPAFAQVLVNRGLKSPSAIKDFISAGPAGFSDPFTMPGMTAAAGRIRKAVAGRERVLVHGDYDADGVTATAILVRALRKIGLDVSYFIPHRIEHGYGFTSHGVAAAESYGAGLIITVDCGITSFEAVDEAGLKGIDVIITDHHEPDRVVCGDAASCRLPDAVAVVNPRLLDTESPAVWLSGAGCAFKLAQALGLTDGITFSTDDALALLDLAAIGTVADVVPLTGENRTIVREGLRGINEARRPGIKGLRDVCGLGSREVRASQLAFTIAPRINAAGRVAQAADVVRLLLCDDESEAIELSSWLNRLNGERQRIEEDIYQQARFCIDGKDPGPVIVLSGQGWHPGVLGIVASRIAEEYARPAFVFSLEDGVAKGSARSIPAFNIHEGLSRLSDLLIAFGGHRQAAGLKLRSVDLSIFEERISKIVSETLCDGDFLPTVTIDAEVGLSEITPILVNELAALEPFGCGNEEPLFAARGLAVEAPRIVGSNHLKMRLRKNNHSIDTVGFDLGGHIRLLDSASVIDAVFTPGVNEWKGSRYLQLVLRAFRSGQ